MSRKRSSVAMLLLDRVGKTYPNGVHALGGVSFEVELGEILAVIGGSGCGKSTLLRAIAGLDPPSEGAVVLDGERIGAPHAKIGIIFQEPRLLSWLRVADNVGFGSPTSRKQSACSESPRRSIALALPTKRACGRANCRAAKHNASPLRGHWCRVRKCFCSTSRSPPWMLLPGPICRTICSICGRTPSRRCSW